MRLRILVCFLSVVSAWSQVSENGSKIIQGSINYVSGGGSANAQTATYSPAIIALVTGAQYCWLPIAANTTDTPTLAINGLTATTITKLGHTALVANDLTTTAVACAIYDGTDMQLQNPQTTSSAAVFPLTFVQEAALTATAAATTTTVTFPKTTAASGNTLFMFVAADGSGSVTTPAGWTKDLDVTQASFARFLLYHKTSAAESSVNIVQANSAAISVYFFEVTGSHTLDQSSTGGVANTQNLTFPAITPTANAVVFGMACFVTVGAMVPAPNINPAWRLLYIGDGVNGERSLGGFVLLSAATNVATTPPQLGLNGTVLFSSGGIAYATFSIL